MSIGDRHLAFTCSGTGSPLVVFEAGYGGGIDNWVDVLPGVGEQTRACSYDRAGVGLSDPPDTTPRTAKEVASDFTALIEVLGPGQPIVLVGFSIGGLFARYYAGTDPGKVAGLVLIDPTPPEWPAMSLEGVQVPQMASQLRLLTGFDERAPEQIDTLKVGIQALVASPIRVPIFMLIAGIVSLNPGIPGDELTYVMRHLQLDQKADMGAEMNIAELCTHAIPHDCPDEVVSAVVKMAELVRSTGPGQPHRADPAVRMNRLGFSIGPIEAPRRSVIAFSNRRPLLAAGHHSRDRKFRAAMRGGAP